jgi:hypothetical protein
MPLVKSASKKAVGENIKREEAAGRPHKQAVAIALETQRRAGGGKKKPKHSAKKVYPHLASKEAR